jgi:hypothetical protein
MRILIWFTRTRVVLFYAYLVIWSSETILYEDPTRKVREYKMKQTKFI